MCAEFDSMAEACIDTAFAVMEHGSPGMRAAVRTLLAELRACERERALDPSQDHATARGWGYHALHAGPAEDGWGKRSVLDRTDIEDRPARMFSV